MIFTRPHGQEEGEPGGPPLTEVPCKQDALLLRLLQTVKSVLRGGRGGGRGRLGGGGDLHPTAMAPAW